MSAKKPKKKEEMTRQVLSVQVIHYVCTNCGEEIEEVKICDSCKAPMRVLEVKEFFGDEARTKLDELIKKPASLIKTSTGEENIEQVNVLNGIADDDELDKIDGIDGPTSTKEKDEEGWDELEVMASGSIFGADESDEEIEAEPQTKKSPKNNDELTALLDKEDDEIDMKDLDSDFQQLGEL